MDRLRFAAAQEKETAADKLAGPEFPANFGMFYPFDFVQQAAEILRLSSWASWPSGGGWADESDDLVADIMLYFKLDRRAKWEAENGITSSKIATQSYNPDSSGKKYGLGRT